jgi:hypothetical protein
MPRWRGSRGLYGAWPEHFRVIASQRVAQRAPDDRLREAIHSLDEGWIVSSGRSSQ